MTKAPSILAAALLAAFLCLGEPAYCCSECFCISDNSCTNAGCGENLTANCTRHEFSPRCDGYYSFYTETRCTGGTGSCSKCQACANLFKLSGGVEEWIANCHTADCNAATPNCTYDCGQTPVQLLTGNTYVLYVCKVPCPTFSCVSCTDNCTAYACMSINMIFTPCVP